MIRFTIVLEEDEDGWFTATVPSLPGCISEGKTKEEAKKNIAEAISLHLEPLDDEESPEDQARRKRFLTEIAAIEAEGDFVEYLP
jgi:predicted RNase H-like HicB family nuclease